MADENGADRSRPELRMPKHHWIAERVSGRSFADIGGLWGAVNETVTIASHAGAREVTMIDIQHEGSKWWAAFHERCAQFGVKDYGCKVADLCDKTQLEGIGRFDFVHCSGIVYHVSDPIAFVRNLMLVAREYLIIGSMLIPEKIENEHGVLMTPPGTFRCVPLLDEAERRIIGAHYDKLNVKVGGVNAPAPTFVDPETGRIRTGPWWHLFTGRTMEDICRLCGAEVLESSTTWQGAQNILCRVGG
ncbi:MAG: hypothetical protein ACK5MQ_03620 [Pikeienuella sp.]